MPVNPEVKGTLAKLLATENLNVEHRSVSTAYFDVVNRTLCLPIWKNVSNFVYDMLVGHEVGHALYTPLDYIDAAQDVPQDILNVLEDVRVEKMMKRRYPGLSKSFYEGYAELDKKDFFELKDKDLSKMSFIDRINVHYKIGVVGNRTIVPFDRDEIEYLNRASDTESFDDVIQLGKDILDFLDRKKEQQQKVDLPNPPQSESGGGSNPEESDVEQVGPASNEQTGNSSSNGSDFDSDGDQPTQDGGDSTQVGGRRAEPDQTVSETYRALTENQKELVDRKAKDYVYINTPKFNLNNTIVPFKKVLEDFNEWSSNTNIDLYENAQKKYIKYKKDSIKSVNYLVKEFECKKAADQYARASTSRTGVLDTARLHTYKFSDDVFKKVTTIPDGKNHGLVFYLDWSGSMTSILSSTMKQLYDLIWFCKKVSIPFRVYAFSDASNNEIFFPGKPTDNVENTVYVDDSFRLFEFFSSKMNAQTLEKMMSMMYVNAIGHSQSGDTNHKYFLSGTPLVETILSTPQIVEKFKSEEKVQKVNVIYLSDGEACYPMYNKYIERFKEVHRSGMHGYYASDVFVLRDSKSRYQSKIDCGEGNITNQFVKYISNIVDYNLLGFRLCNKTEVRNQARYCDANMEVVEKEWTKFRSVALSNCGFKQLYLMQTPKLSYHYGSYWDPNETENEIEVKDPSSKAQLANAFKKHMNGKMVNKTILSKFISQIA